MEELIVHTVQKASQTIDKAKLVCYNVDKTTKKIQQRKVKN
jgi:hypothetical protein